MHITNLKTINKKICNTSNKDKFIKEVVLFSCKDLRKLNISLKDVNVYRSARHKNDMPTVFKLGQISDALNDGLIKIAENGNSISKEDSNLIISDHLTILGNNKKAFVIAFLGGKKHLIRTEINIDKKGKFISLQVIAEINKILKSKETFTTENIEIFNTDDANESIEYFANKKLKEIKLKRKQCPSVYCTWYYYGSTITFKDCLTNLNEIKKRNLPLNTFQIDDGWEDYIGDWNANKKFLGDMKKVANKIKEYNLIPGLWTSPFIVDKKSQFAKTHKDFLLYDYQNKPCIFSMNNNDFYIIDITNKDTWIYFEKLYRHLTNDYGFKYHKLDFTRAPLFLLNANYKNKYITIIESYRNACLAIRKGMGNDSFFLMCGGLYDPLIGIVDAQRSGSDVLSMWSAANRGGKTLPFTMKQSLLRYYMNTWWYNDPDCYVIRKNKKKYKNLKISLGLLNDNEVKTSTINQILGGGFFSMTEPLDKISEDRLNNVYHILPNKVVDIELVDILNSPRYPNLVRIKDKKKRYLAVINYDDNKKLNKTFTSKDIDESTNKKYKINILLAPHSATILELTDKNIKEVDNKGRYLK